MDNKQAAEALRVLKRALWHLESPLVPACVANPSVMGDLRSIIADLEAEPCAK